MSGSQKYIYISIRRKYIYVYIYTSAQKRVANDLQLLISLKITGWQRLIGSLSFIGHFPQKWHIFGGSFVKNDLQFRGSYESSPPCKCPDTTQPQNERESQTITPPLILKKNLLDVRVAGNFAAAEVPDDHTPRPRVPRLYLVLCIANGLRRGGVGEIKKKTET